MYLGVEPYLRRSAQSSRVVALTLSSQSGALAASSALRTPWSMRACRRSNVQNRWTNVWLTP